MRPTQTETLARARSDLRLGLPVVLVGGGQAMLAVAAEALTAERLGDLRSLGSMDLAVTARRAETLKARAYDGDVARIAVPGNADLRWLLAVADPADDLFAAEFLQIIRGVAGAVLAWALFTECAHASGGSGGGEAVG